MTPTRRRKLDARATLVEVGLVAALGALGCGGPRFVRRTQVERELRVRAAARPAVDRWFAAVWAVQGELAAAEGRRLTTQLQLHQALSVSPTAPLDVVAAALQRALAEAGTTRVPFRIQPTTEERAARDRWLDQVRAGASSERQAAFAALESALAVNFLVRPEQRQAMARVLDPVEQHLRRVAALDVTMAALMDLADALQAERAALSLQAGSQYAAEFIAAADFLDSVRPRATLQVQESRRTELWLRGVFVPEGDDIDDEEFLHELDRLRE